jgi:hypothetical protein
MKIIRINFLLLIGLLSLGACHKQDDPTVINLTVVDYFTGQPLDSVVYLLAARYRYNSKVHEEGDLKWTRGGTTDATGIIQYTFKSDEDGEFGSLKKKGYIIKTYISHLNNENSVTQSVYNEFKVTMRPFDAYLKVNLHNTQINTDSLFLIIRSATLQNEEQFYTYGHHLGFPFVVSPNNDLSFYIPTVANEPLTIYWSWDKMDRIKPAPLCDQLSIPKGDTLIYSISN